MKPPVESERREAVAGDLYPGDSRGRKRRRWLLGADLIGLGVAATVFSFAYSADWEGGPGPSGLLLIGSFVLIWIVASALLGYYHAPERRIDYTAGDDLVPLIVTSTLASWFALISAAGIAGGMVPIGPWFLLWVGSIAAVAASRAGMRRIARTRSWYRQKVLLVGTAADLDRIRRRLDRHPEFGLDATAAVYLDPPGGPVNGNGHYPSTIHLPLQVIFAADGEGVAEIVEFAANNSVNRVLIATPPRGLDERETIARALSHGGFAVDIASTEVGGISQRAALHHLEGLPIITLPVIEHGRVRAIAKRAFDLTAGLSALALFSPLLIGIAIAIRVESRGPVLFRQTRIGQGRREFRMIKFRTMVDGAEKMKDQLAEHNIHANRDGGRMFKIPDDPRITRVGAWLRRYSLDEVPQLFNVVRGEMSLVGPRPLIPGEAVLVDDSYDARFSLRPGMTGPWQAHGRSEIGFDDMVRLDDTYARNWSLSGDIELIIRTVGAVSSGKGAY